jgi:hypothetical protein
MTMSDIYVIDGIDLDPPKQKFRRADGLVDVSPGDFQKFPTIDTNCIS